MRRLIIEDNLTALHKIPSDSVDLCATDPPFNSGRNYGMDADVQDQMFTDTWKWDTDSLNLYNELSSESRYSNVVRFLDAFALMHGDPTKGKLGDLRSYLTFMAPRIVEIHRVLKKTGTFFLHCDSNGSYYLKPMLDVVFGSDNFRNDIFWKRMHGRKNNITRGLSKDTDTILRYTKTSNFIWNVDAVSIPFNPEDPETFPEAYKKEPSTGRYYRICPLDATVQDSDSPMHYEFLGFTRTWRWTKSRMQDALKSGKIIQSSPGVIPRQKVYVDDSRGYLINNIWDDICGVPQGRERLGYPTQKPLKLYERLVRVASNEGDIVLDPFVGSGTTIDASERHKRGGGLVLTGTRKRLDIS